MSDVVVDEDLVNPREKSLHQLSIEEFMTLAKQDVPGRPVLPSKPVRELRAKLILEETIETIEGLGFKISVGCLNRFAHNGLKISNVELTEVYPPNLEKIVDGCGDLSVVTIGTLSACGVADTGVLRVVDEANLRKFGPGSYARPDGKWMKPKDFKPADVKKVIDEQGEAVYVSEARTEEVNRRAS